MWLNEKQILSSAIRAHRKSMLGASPNHVVIDNLFDEAILDKVLAVLQQPQNWQTQKHTYSALYVDNVHWHQADNDQRFVKRDIWQRNTINTAPRLANSFCANIAQDFLAFLRGDEFISVLSRIFNVSITDMNVAEPAINTNYFRLGPSDFVSQHADDSPGREVCMLLYLNKGWNDNAGGELLFMGEDDTPISIAPLYNRCVLFDPFSNGSEHWVKALNAKYINEYRYNVTSWYWSE